eukprot:360946-Chlamydomonas_euryale.AAC.7
MLKSVVPSCAVSCSSSFESSERASAVSSYFALSTCSGQPHILRYRCAHCDRRHSIEDTRAADFHKCDAQSSMPINSNTCLNGQENFTHNLDACTVWMLLISWKMLKRINRVIAGHPKQAHTYIYSLLGLLECYNFVHQKYFFKYVTLAPRCAGVELPCTRVASTSMPGLPAIFRITQRDKRQNGATLGVVNSLQTDGNEKALAIDLEKEAISAPLLHPAWLSQDSVFNIKSVASA